MTMSFGGFGSSGFGSHEPDVQSKLAALKAKKGNNPEANVAKYLSEDLGVDIRELPYNLNSANERLKEIAGAEGADIVDISGNSMGITSLALSTSIYGDILCPKCANAADGYWRDTSGPNNTGTWNCYDCGEEYADIPLPDTTLKTATPNDHQGLDWHDVLRIYTAYHKYIHGEGDYATRDYWSFKAAVTYAGVNVSPVEPQSVNPDPKSYPTGTILRLEKHVLDENGGTTSEHEYVRIGGLFDDDTITILSSMKPIQDLTGWTVTEDLT
jgi:hypothetical protein